MPRSTTSKTPLLAGLGTVAVLVLAWLVLLDDPPAAPSGGGAPVNLVNGPGGGGGQLPAAATGGAPADGRPSGRERVAPEPAPPRGPEHIAVRVFDVDRGKPVVAFQVTVLPAGSVPPVERLGEAPPEPFHLKGGIATLKRPPGTYDVVVQAPGYLPGELSGVVVPASLGRPHDVPLSRGAGIAGMVLGPDGLARPGLDVFLELVRLADPLATPPRATLTKSGADGGFSFSPLPDGEYAVTALEMGNTDDRISGIRVYGSPTKVVIHLLPRHLVTLKVEDLRGRPVGGAMVEVSGGGSIQTATSNPAGLVVIDNVTDGTYAVRVLSDGYRELQQEIELSGGTGQHLHWLRLEPVAPGEG
jgi:hypothetical protein